jgi:hypothetical protein
LRKCACTKKVSYQGVTRDTLNLFLGGVSLCVVATTAVSSAKFAVVAFSTLLLAQVPCDVLSGVEGFLTRFIFLVAFHRE